MHQVGATGIKIEEVTEIKNKIKTYTYYAIT
jgi:hypothetical protein